MSITSIPLQTESAGQLGKSKSDGSGTYDADTKISAAQWNQVVLRLISAFQEIGLSDGSTVGSLRKAINDAAASLITDVIDALAGNALAIDFNDVDLTGIGVLHPATLTVDGDAYIGGNLTLTGTIDSLTFKQIVRLATTANGTLATAFENGDTLDGKTLVTGDRILLKNQSTPAENGIYVVNASGAPSRSFDCNAAGDLAHGLVVAVAAGDTNGGHIFMCTAITAVPGSTGLAFIDVGPLTNAALATLLGAGDVNVTGPVGINASGNLSVSGHGGDASVSTGSIGEVVISTGDGLLVEFSDRADFNGALLTGLGDGGADTDGVNWRALRNSESVKKTAAYTLLSGDPRIIQVDDTAGRVDLTLPNPTTQRAYTIHKIAGTTGGIRLIRFGSEKIMTVAASYDLPGATTAFSSTAPQAWLVYTDGTDWFVC